jgi:cytochrome o ubiquinol oxidase subunit 1
MPFYNFAIIPTVTDRDPFWVTKHPKTSSEALQVIEHPADKVYSDITLPKNSAAGIIIAGFAFLFAFAMVWHIVWLGIFGLLGLAITIIIKSTQEDSEYTIPASEVALLDIKYSSKQSADTGTN